MNPARRRNLRRTAIAVIASVAIAVGWIAAARVHHFPHEPKPPVAASDIASSADALLVRFAERSRWEGAALISKDETILWERAIGDEISTDTPFSIASLTKPLTAFVLLDLAESARLSFDDPAAAHIPELTGAYAGGVTISQLLSMRADLPLYWPLRFAARAQLAPDSVTTDALVEQLRRFPADGEDDESFRYSNSAYVLLALIAERASARPFEALLREVIFEPYGLGNAGSFGADDDSLVPAGHLPVQRFGVTGGVGLIRLPRWDYRAVRGATGVFASVRDLSRWGNALNRLRAENRGLDLTSVAGEEDAYRMGLQIMRLDGRTVLECPGEDPGYYGFMAWVPEQSIFVAMLSSTDFQLAASNYDLGRELLDLALGLPYEAVRP